MNFFYETFQLRWFLQDREVRDVPVALPLYSEQEPIVYVGPWTECRPQQKYLNKRDVNSFSQNQPHRSNQQHYQVQDSYFSNPSNPAPVGAEPVFFPGSPGAHPPSPEDLPFFINSFDAKSQPKQWNSLNSVQGRVGKLFYKHAGFLCWQENSYSLLIGFKPSLSLNFNCGMFFS